MENLLQALQEAPDLKHVPTSQLEWLLKRSECRTFQQGEHLFRKDDPIDHMYIVLYGSIQFRLEQGGQFRVLSTLNAGGIGGTLPYSRTSIAKGFGYFVEDTKLLFLRKEHFRVMTGECYELTEALVHFMTSRARSFVAMEQQTEKMAALGRISAGLAHELNNPSAAIVRSADALKKHLSSAPDKFKRVMLLNLDLEGVDVCNTLFFTKASAGIRYDLSPLEKSDAEDALLDWLEDHGIDSGFDIVGNLVDFHFLPQDLESVLQHIGAEGFFTVLEWLNDLLTTERFVAEIGEASKRINDIVSAVKSYSHLDRAAERQQSDIHEGLRKTLMIMAHKLKKNHVSVIEQFAPDLPQPRVYIGELNQVWTNLLDNAIDALEDADIKKLELITSAKNGFIEVCIVDSGAGIPPEILSSIFDPFFTTKAMGKGTGLGLNAVQRIIEQHNGEIKVTSVPGRTEFKVCLPL